MESKKSKETLNWESLLGEFISWYQYQELQGKGKMIGGVLTKAQFIKKLKSKYYLDLMRHQKEKISNNFSGKNINEFIEIDLAKIPKGMAIQEFNDNLKMFYGKPTQKDVDDYLEILAWEALSNNL